ncbi:MAG: pyridoxamine 5'-phosphate oxidase family protein [Solirubrobacteraceae bacterium]|nr:pyridoxamine 5'-phosphate oxidase family protein [Solirubrobacteraceae bacterium]
MTDAASPPQPSFHGGPGSGPLVAAPSHEVPPAATRSPAEEARTLVDSQIAGSLASLSDDGTPWASIVTYGATAKGEPVLVLSSMAEHGRNLQREPRCSIVIAEPVEDGVDPLDRARVTLAGRIVDVDGEEADSAIEAHAENFPHARAYARYGDFTTYVLKVERVRWVGGFARMGTVEAADYAAAEPDPTWPGVADARAHLNADHADALVLWARTLGGYDDAATATCEAIDRYGVDLKVVTPRGPASARVAFAEPVAAPVGLRAAPLERVTRANAWDDGGLNSHH